MPEANTPSPGNPEGQATPPLTPITPAPAAAFTVPPVVPIAPPTMTILSTAQRGVSLSALKAARACGFPTGAYMTRTYGTLDGVRPEYRGLYGAVALPTNRADDRLKACVDSSDATLLFVANEHSEGASKVIALLNEAGKPYRVVPCRQFTGNPFYTDPQILAELVITCDWMMHHSPNVLHIWGPSTQRLASIAEIWLAGLLQAYRSVTSAEYQPGNDPFTNIEAQESDQGDEDDDAVAAPVASDNPTPIVDAATADDTATSATVYRIEGGHEIPTLPTGYRWRGEFVIGETYQTRDVVHLEETIYTRLDIASLTNFDPRSEEGQIYWEPILTLVGETWTAIE